MLVASLSGRKYGVHKNIVYVYTVTLGKSKYKLKISSKVSNTSYQHCEKFLIHGTGQGSENSPMIRCFISSILFNYHNQKANGTTLSSPSGDIVVSSRIVSFVDDSMCVIGGK